jgi:site-specific DNA recombinase
MKTPRVAFYGRYSTDKQRQESIEDQLLVCRRFAERHGWSISQEYSDQAHTGADNARPQYQAMLAAATRHEFDMVIADDLSRLTRDASESHRLVKTFEFQNIRLMTVADGVDTDVKGYQFILAFRATQNELYLEDVASKTHRGLLGKACQGLPCGGKVYGYKRVVQFSESEKDEYGRPKVLSIDIAIDEDQATVVREIFRLYVAGWSPMKIAAELNERKVPAIGSKRNTSNTWGRSTIYGDMKKGTGMLNNGLYIGQFTWNRSHWKKEPGTARRVREMRPESELVEFARPDLAILDADLWSAAKKRQEADMAKSSTIRQALNDRARTGRTPSSLLSGVLTCARCGGNYVVISRTHYGCARHKERGNSVCSNSRTISKHAVDELVLPALRNGLLSETTKQLFVEELSRRLKREATTTPSELRALTKRLRQVEGEAANLVKAIKEGVALSLVRAELSATEESKAALERQITTLKAAAPGAGLDKLEVGRLYDGLVAKLPDVLRGDMHRARALIHRLTGGIELTPAEGGVLEARIRGSLAGMLEEASAGTPHSNKINVVAGARFELATFGL